ATTELYTLSLHDALPISGRERPHLHPAQSVGDHVCCLRTQRVRTEPDAAAAVERPERVHPTRRLPQLASRPDRRPVRRAQPLVQDRKSTRLNSSHVEISY